MSTQIPLTNEHVIKHFERLAELCDGHRAAAFTKAAIAVRRLGDRSIADVYKAEKIRDIGGSSIQEITEVLETGTSKRLQQLDTDRNGSRSQVPEVDLHDLQRLRGIGPVAALKIWSLYKVGSVAELDQKIAYGEVKDADLIAKVEELKKTPERIDRILAEQVATPLLSSLQDIAIDNLASFAGSMRRKRPTVRDIDICMATEDPSSVVEILHWNGYKIESSGNVKIRVLLPIDDDRQVGCDILMISRKEWACGLTYLTGSKDFAPIFRGAALKAGFSINEHRVLRLSDKTALYPSSEEDLFELVGYPYLAPENREV